MRRVFSLASCMTVLLVIIIGTASAGEISNMNFFDYEVTDAYKFPVKPGMKEWSTFKTHNEMTHACQIPGDMLRTMSTEGLLETYMNYPLFIDIIAFNSFQEGFDQIIANFNGLQELLKRDDSGEKLLGMYRKMAPESVIRNGKDMTALQRANFTFGFMRIEMLLAQETVFSKLSKDTRRALLEECLNKYRQKQKAGMSGITRLAPIGLIMDNIMKKYEGVISVPRNLMAEQKDDAVYNNLDGIISNAERFITK